MSECVCVSMSVCVRDLELYRDPRLKRGRLLHRCVVVVVVVVILVVVVVVVVVDVVVVVGVVGVKKNEKK